MNKVTLGNDFTDEESSDSSDEKEEEKQSDEKSDEENENSAESSNSENLDKTEELDSEDNPDSDEKSDEEKSKELQGLLDAEKNLDNSNASVDEDIAAARARISQKRKERREKREVVNTVDSKFPEEEEVDLSDIDSETLKVLDKYTRARGLIPKSEVEKINYNNQQKTAEENFYEKHSEYDINNDPDNTLYNAIRKELSYFATPKDPRMIPKLFEKAHREVVKLYPDKFRDEKKSDNNINKSIRLKTQSLGGKSSGGSASKSREGSKEWSDVQVNAMRQGGWSDKEIKDLLK